MKQSWGLQSGSFNLEMLNSLKLQREIVEKGFSALIAEQSVDGIIYYAEAARELLSKIDESAEYFSKGINEEEQAGNDDY